MLVFCSVGGFGGFFGPFYIFSLHDCLPPALHFVVLNYYEVPLDTSATELCNVSHQENICNQAEELIPTPFLLIYYSSSQVLAQIFITLACIRLGYDADNRIFLEVKVCARISLDHTLLKIQLLTQWDQSDGNAVNYFTHGSHLICVLFVFLCTSFAKVTLLIIWLNNTPCFSLLAFYAYCFLASQTE